MALDFQQVREQVKELGENAPLREQRLQELRQDAYNLLHASAHDLERLRQRVEYTAGTYDPTLRCALPTDDALNAHFPLPVLAEQATILAADGSQIAPDRNSPVDYCLINVGAICMQHGSSDPPAITVRSKLFYDDEMYAGAHTITDGALALMRDLNERTMLAELAEQSPAPVITFTDGPMELWGSKDADGAMQFQQKLEAYKEALYKLYELQVTTAGYVDKPAANLVVRLLEIGKLDQDLLPQIKTTFPFRGVTDRDLFRRLLGPCERSAMFAIQSKSAINYQDELGLHFFYLNVGRENHPWIARVEVPAWVAENCAMLDNLHAALVGQCRIMGARPYPYLLHRAHEAAVVSFEEKDQVTQMIIQELYRRGVVFGEQSNKQFAKGLSGKTHYQP